MTSAGRGMSLPAKLITLLIRIYQPTLGLVFGGQCRFFPTCSEYGIQALRTHGAVQGSWLTMKRILRCHPFGWHGFDPVPERSRETACEVCIAPNDGCAGADEKRPAADA